MREGDCPFCGADDICVADDDTHDFCNVCGARGPYRGDDHGWNNHGEGELNWRSRAEITGLVELRDSLENAKTIINDLLGMVP